MTAKAESGVEARSSGRLHQSPNGGLRLRTKRCAQDDSEKQEQRDLEVARAGPFLRQGKQAAPIRRHSAHSGRAADFA